MKDIGGYTMQMVLSPTRAQQVGPSIVRHLGIGGMLGFIVGFVLAFWRERSDKRFRAPEDISDAVGSPVVAHIPSIPVEEAVTLEDSLIDRMVCTYHQPQSLFAEAYRAARVAMYFNTQGETNKVFQITSPSPGDGKSTLSANLAVSIANTGKRTLLLEGDFRRPRVHEIIGLDVPVGVPAVLAGQAEINDAIYDTEVENLWCMPCGLRPSNPAELLSSEEFKEFLETVRQQFDFVIIDSPRFWPSPTPARSPRTWMASTSP